MFDDCDTDSTLVERSQQLEVSAAQSATSSQLVVASDQLRKPENSSGRKHGLCSRRSRAEAKSKFAGSMEVVEKQLIEVMNAVVDEIEGAAKSLAETVSSGGSLAEVVSDSLDNDLKQDESKRLFTEICASPSAQSLYLLYNKTSAVNNLSKRLLDEVQKIFNHADGNLLCPKVHAAAVDCLDRMEKFPS